MALVPAGPPVPGISIKQCLDDLTLRIEQIRRKTKTLIDYYIYPEATPSEISAYDPRILKLASRLETLSKLNCPNLAFLLDDSDTLVCSYIIEVIDQICHAIDGLQAVFQNHYDRRLEARKPYESIFQTVEFRERQLKDIIHNQMSNPHRRRPEDRRPNQAGAFCRGAIMMVNNRDAGKISFVEKRDLLDENRAKLAEVQGAFMWWQCPDCAFKLRYHINTATQSLNIYLTDEVREHRGCSIEYKSAFLTKVHLFQPRNTGINPRASRGSFSSNSFPSSAKYGCVFCFANGKKLERGETAFTSGRELAIHTEAKHKKTLPPAPMLQKFNVAVKGRLANQVRIWDINFR